MADLSEWIDILGRALRSPAGVEVKLLNPQLALQKLYQARKESVAFEVLKIHRITDDTFWIVKKDRKL